MTVRFVAEAASNHNRDLKRCLAFVKHAAQIGCWAVKFQLFKIDQLFAPEVLQKSEAHRQRRGWELPVEFLPEIASYCREFHVKFGCTPFYLRAIEELYPYVDFYKISSYEILWTKLLVETARTGKPVVLSTGMATLPEVEEAVSILKNYGCQDLTLLHCVSAYPAQIVDCNLAAIASLRKRFQCPVGWSDHSRQAAVLYRAVHRWEAEMIEFHMDLDATGFEYSLGHCWKPEEIKDVIENIQKGLRADGKPEKTYRTAEKEERLWRADPADGLRPIKPLRHIL
ncbi:MAG: N-acetylneuraminic acid synthase [Calditrichaeota bacterium]|nr:MAG: N-acetylneuraminic acid synthase [Calditrichota bacterium]